MSGLSMDDGWCLFRGRWQVVIRGPARSRSPGRCACPSRATTALECRSRTRWTPHSLSRHLEKGPAGDFQHKLTCAIPSAALTDSGNHRGVDQRLVNLYSMDAVARFVANQFDSAASAKG